MRRKDKEIKDRAENEEIIQQAAFCHLALADGDRPYVVPLCFGYADGFLFLHSAAEGMKLDILKKNDRVCFSMETDVKAVKGETPCEWGMAFRSVIGFGRAEILHDREDKITGLDAIMKHNKGSSGEYPDAYLKITKVIRVTIEQMTGKKSGSDS